MKVRLRILMLFVVSSMSWIGAIALYAQEEILDAPVTLENTNASVQQILLQLKAANIQIAYSESYLNVSQTVRLPRATLTLRELLNVIGQATNTTYQVRDGQIIFRKKDARYTISGYIRNAGSGEDLIGANVWSARSAVGTGSNDYGFYSLTLPADTVRLQCSYVGHATQQATFVLSADTVINWNLTEEMLAEVIVSASNTQFVEEQTYDMPVPTSVLLSMPTLLGEVDVLKSLQRLPGVQAGSDGGAALYVRGSSPDQNLILLDGVPVYNAMHLFGFFSVFNADAVNHVQFYKDGFPARYGGRLASVIDIHLKEGNRQEFQGSGSVGLLSTRLTLEGPLFSEKTSFLLSGRYAHLSPLTRLLTRIADTEDIFYSFHDATAKINHTFSHRDQVYLSTYFGQDYYRTEDQYERAPSDDFNAFQRNVSEERIQWGNVTTALRWNHVFNRQLFSNLTLTYSRYRFELNESAHAFWKGEDVVDQNTDEKGQRTSGIRDWAAKVDFDYWPYPRHHVRFGGNMIWHTFRPGTARYTFREDERLVTDTIYGAPLISNIEGGLFIEDEVQLLPSVNANIGLHLAGFQVDQRSYLAWQPRLSLHYQPSTATHWQASYTRMAQFIHLATNLALSLPSDLWLPSTQRVAPETAHQWTLGYQRTLRSYTVQAETYYKTLQNVVEFKEGGFSFYESVFNWENRVASGRGRSYGIEMMAQRTAKRLNGWLSYTLSRSERQFDEVNGGNWFPFKYDRRHEVDVGGIFHWKDHINVSFGWGLATGFALTLPTVTFAERGLAPDDNYWDNNLVVYGTRNSQRARATHRLDVSIAFRKTKRWGERTWEFGIYNIYSRKNPFSIDFYQNEYGKNSGINFYETSLFPILPSVSYQFKF